MAWYTRFAVVAGAGLLALMVLLSLVAADGGGSSGPGMTSGLVSGDIPPTPRTVPPDCEPPKMCPVVVDTDQDGYSDYDENAYGSDPSNRASTPESWAFGTCQDGHDNDSDGAVDGADSGCSDPCSSPTPTPMESPGMPDYYPYCDKDTDGDGFFDSDEINSGSDPNNAASTPEDWAHGTCADGADNDLDGVTDGADNGCASACEPPVPMPMAQASDATPVGTPVDGGSSDPGPTCDADSDGDGYSDWNEISSGSDPNNPASTPEAAWYPGTCGDGADNDLDGHTDDTDDACSSACVPPPGPPEGTPGTEPVQPADVGSSPSQPCVADSDGDGVDDGTEQMLGSNPNASSSLPEHLKFLDSCTDGTDNDGDNLTDAADPGCQSDSDGDAVPDLTDNCPAAWNPDQTDSDQDGTGDACQDSDSDGYSDAEEISWGSDPDHAASTPEVLWAGDSCNDGRDDDGDQATDSADSGCTPLVPLPPGSGLPEEFVGKDANCDLRISALDALFILRSVAGLPPISSESPCVATAQGSTAPGDADCSGAVDAVDSLDVLRYIAGLSPAPGHC